MLICIMFSLYPVNFGGLLLQALLEHWPRTHTIEPEEIPHATNGMDTSSDENKSPRDTSAGTLRTGNGYFSVLGHTPVIFSEVGGRTLFRFLCRDAGGDSERLLLNETVPQWVVDITVDVSSSNTKCVLCNVLPASCSLTFDLIGGDSERLLLNETVPQWVVDITVDVSSSTKCVLSAACYMTFDLTDLERLLLN